MIYIFEIFLVHFFVGKYYEVLEIFIISLSLPFCSSVDQVCNKISNVITVISNFYIFSFFSYEISYISVEFIVHNNPLCLC